MKKSSGIIYLLLLVNLSAFGFRPLGHVLLKEKIIKALPDDNPFKKAMIKYPQIASWGAIGPDLGYNIDFSRTGKIGWKRQIKNSWQLADMAHYHMVGSFVTNLVKKAKELNDEKFYAFVGGWITHIAGDFGSHGIYVKPEAGYYIAYEEGRDLHSELEKISDTYLYSEYAKEVCLSGFELEPAYYWKALFGVRPSPNNAYEKKENKKILKKFIGGNLQKNFIEVYKTTYMVDEVHFDLVHLASNYYRAVGGGIGKYAGFKHCTLEDMKEKIKLNRRKALIDSAFAKAIEYGVDFLQRAVNPDPQFSNEWNLDIGEHGGATYVLRIDARKKPISRTKNDVFVSFKNKNGGMSPEIKITTKIGPMKFAFYQEDAYFYAVNLGGAMGELNCWSLENISEVVLAIRKRPGQLFSNTFRIKKIELFYNGESIKYELKPCNKRIKLKRRKRLTLKL